MQRPDMDDGQLNDDARTGVTRRSMLKRTTGAMVAMSSTASALAAWGTSASAGAATTSAGASGVPLASKSRPLTLPLYATNKPIASGLRPEKGPLQIYVWGEYLSTTVAKAFGKRHGVSVQITNASSDSEMVDKVLNGVITPDLWWPNPSHLPSLVAAKKLQPINHSYIPNLASNVLPVASDPWYDRGSRYTVANYFQTNGIFWRDDKLKINPAGMSNSWEVFWQAKVGSKMGLQSGDSFQDLYMALLRRGVNILDRVTQADIQRALTDLKQLAAEGAKFQYTAFQPIANGTESLAFTFNGDMALIPQNLPPHTPLTAVSYFAPKSGALLLADFVCIPSTAKHPVLAHMFLNESLTLESGIQTFKDVGYQRPVKTLTVDALKAAKAADDRVIDMIYITEQQLNNGFPEPILTQQQQLWFEQAFTTLTTA